MHLTKSAAPEKTHPDHLHTLFQRPDVLREPLHVLTTVFNAQRYRSRWSLAENFGKMVGEQPAALLYIAEVAFGAREFVLTDPANPRHLQLRVDSHDEVWQKERSLNLLAQRLPADWKYVAWVDGDVSFARPDWADETRHVLQHHPVVQMWSQANDMNVHHEIMKQAQSFGECLRQDLELPARPGPGTATYYGAARGPQTYWHSGYAWATHRYVWDALGGLLDRAICGAADWHMAWGMLNQIEKTVSVGYSARYKDYLREWGANAWRVVRGDVGVVPGLLLHSWHGPKAARGYNTRNSILVDHQYDPHAHIRPDWQGLWRLAEGTVPLRRALRAYFRERDEDARS
jgi:hypothetical protein